MSSEQANRERLKRLIIEGLNLEGMTPETIADDAPLFSGGLGLDSVDALELVVVMEQEYGIKISNNEINPDVFATVASLSRFIDECTTALKGANA